MAHANWAFRQVFGERDSTEEPADEDLISAVQFDDTGDYLATGDRGGRVVIFESSEVTHRQQQRDNGADGDQAYANGRFLDLKEAPAQAGHGRRKGVENALASHSAARRLVERLAAALQDKGIDMTCFQPNHFATLSVYYDKSPN